MIPYHKDFKFFMTTKLPNPHYTPEVSTKVTLVNFTLSPRSVLSRHCVHAGSGGKVHWDMIMDQRANLSGEKKITALTLYTTHAHTYTWTYTAHAHVDGLRRFVKRPV